jgi:GTP cyclohydrolase I/GTP cyclohydrolase-4
MVRGLIDEFPELDHEAFVLARQENLETIHQHNVVAERYGLLSELREELEAGIHTRRHMTMRDWLEAATD